MKKAFTDIRCASGPVSDKECPNETIIHSFLTYSSFAESKQRLRSWFQSTVTGSFPKSLTRHEREEIVFLYNQVEELFEALYVAYRPDQANDRLAGDLRGSA